MRKKTVFLSRFERSALPPIGLPGYDKGVYKKGDYDPNFPLPQLAAFVPKKKSP